MLKKLFSHSMIYGLAPQISKVAGVFALPIITKDLTSLDFGVWGIILAYVGGLQALSDLGMGVVLSNSFFKMPHQHKWLWKQLYGFLILWSLPFSCFVAAVLWWVIPPEAQSQASLLLILVLLPRLLFGPTTVLGTYYYQLKQKPLPIAFRTAIFGFLTVGLNVYTISYLKLGFMGWAWTNFIVGMLMNISYWYPVNFTLGYSPIFNFKWRTIRQSFKVSLPTIPHQYSAFLLNSSDRIVMDQLQVGVNQLGEYNLASTFGNYFQTLAVAANQAVSPMMLACYKKGQDLEARNLIFVLQVAMLSATFFFSIWSKEILELLIKNDELKEIYPLTIIIVMAYNYRPMYIGAMMKLFYSEKTNLLWRVSFIAGISNIGLNLLLIPIFGFETAAYTTFASLMYMGFAGHFIKAIKSDHTVSFYPLFWLVLIIITTGLAYFCVELDFFTKVLLSIITSCIILYNVIRFKSFLSA